jgi:hypothetical protein
MRYMLVRHKVKDFAQWKRVFDSHAAAQRKAGLTVEHVLRNMDDPSEVFLLFEMENVEKAKSFVTSPDVPGAQEASGVADRPDIFYLHE